MKVPRIVRALDVGWCLRVVCAVMLLGHGWMCWNGQMPLRALLWDEKLLSGVVGAMAGMDWNAWVSSMEVDAGIDRAIRIQGWLCAVFGVSILLPMRRVAVVMGCLATVNLVFLAWLKYSDSTLGLGHFFEHAGQFCLPLVVVLYLCGRRWMWLAMIAVALTFTCHGLSALGVESSVTWMNHPRPGSYVEMTMLCLGLEMEAPAVRILFVAGVFDLVAAVLIFLRGWPRNLALVYMFGWGFATALARPWSHFDAMFAESTLVRWVPEMLLRAPHFGLPLCLLLALWRGRAEDPDTT